MDIIWAPWREKYVVEFSKDRKAKGCVFCTIEKAGKDREKYIFHRSRHCFAVLNIYPFNGGHSLVVPRRHVADLSELTAEERADLLETVVAVQGFITKALKPQGFNIGMNLGHISGAGIPGHLHVHVVPRWSGDMNFMPVLGETKVIPVSLRKVYKALAHAVKS